MTESDIFKIKKSTKKIILGLVVLLIVVWFLLSLYVYKGIIVNDTFSMIWALRSNFMKNVVVPVGGIIVTIFGFWVTVRSNIVFYDIKKTVQIQKEDENRKNKLEEEFLKGYSKIYSNLIAHFERILKSDHSKVYHSWQETDQNGGITEYAIEDDRQFKPIYQIEDAFRYEQTILESSSPEMFKAWLRFQNLLSDNHNYAQKYDEYLEKNDMFFACNSAPEEVGITAEEILDAEADKNKALEEVKVYWEKYNSTEELEKLVVMSLLEYIYITKSSINKISIDFEEYAKLTIKSREISDEDLIKYEKFKISTDN